MIEHLPFLYTCSLAVVAYLSSASVDFDHRLGVYRELYHNPLITRHAIGAALLRAKCQRFLVMSFFWTLFASLTFYAWVNMS